MNQLGRAYPLGATPLGATPSVDGVNFSVYANKATALDLLLFDQVDDAAPSQTIAMTLPAEGSHYWTAFVPGLKPGQLYGYSAHGPNLPEEGVFYDAEKVRWDPYTHAIATPDGYSREAASQPGNNSAEAMKSVVADLSTYDWEGDQPIRRSFAHTIIYEMHVGGFTKHPNSGLAPEKRGTYAGLIEKIPYLKSLGITAVELLPVCHFDPLTGPDGLVNYWGYQTIGFLAPHAHYASAETPLGVLDEFRDMVKALHKADIEVILDVVFNHTAEGFGDTTMLSFRGLANDAYYVLDAQDRSRYADYTGCGTTFNAGHSVVRRLILDSLRFWVEEMHVDGFRFDLASVLTRDKDGKPLPNPPVIWDIDSDPVLAGTKLVAEAWDAAGLYQVGSFVGDAWKEWNGRFRDDVRSFVKSDEGKVGALAQRMTGSPDIYAAANREPEKSVNFITVHDGYTLNDVVSYNDKHNEANGEDNRDGSNDNQSWNCGVEGPTDDPTIEALRNRQVKNFLTLLLMAAGAPLISMGDEVRRTQQGNNNAYCQDNEISWFDWSLVDEHADMLRFVQHLIAGRLQRSADRTGHETLTALLNSAEVTFHGVELNQPDESPHSLAIFLKSSNNVHLHMLINAYWEPLTFQLPQIDANWRRWLDTNLPSPDDITTWEAAPVLASDTYDVAPRSVVVLIS